MFSSIFKHWVLPLSRLRNLANPKIAGWRGEAKQLVSERGCTEGLHWGPVLSDIILNRESWKTTLVKSRNNNVELKAADPLFRVYYFSLCVKFSLAAVLTLRHKHCTQRHKDGLTNCVSEWVEEEKTENVKLSGRMKGLFQISDCNPNIKVTVGGIMVIFCFFFKMEFLALL